MKMKTGCFALIGAATPVATTCFIRFANTIHHQIRNWRPHHTLASSLYMVSLKEGSRMPVNTNNRHMEKYKITTDAFVQEVISFLDCNMIHWRPYAMPELRNVLEHYSLSANNVTSRQITRHRVEEIMTLMEDRIILAVGRGVGDNSAGDAPHRSYSFILHLCPTQTYNAHTINATAVASFAWLNAHLTDAFYSHRPPDERSLGSKNANYPDSIIVHLHKDVWIRSRCIVQSRLRSKCGIFDRRIYGRQTVVKRIGKSEYIPFLEKNHLWAATSAKYGYGLFLKPSVLHSQNCNESDLLVAVATFTHKRRVKRASQQFHSYKLLRFCTMLDTTVVGGLTKLISAFVKDAKKREDSSIPMDLITTIDRDFGCNTWPKFEVMGKAMDPIPMFVSDVDGLRRHAVGAGVNPLEHQIKNEDIAFMTASQLLRSGLPASLTDQLQKTNSDSAGFVDVDRPWKLAAQQRFSPVFDAGVERLMLVVDDGTTGPSMSELWETCVPQYATDHYSSNAGVEIMLHCIQRAKDAYSR